MQVIVAANEITAGSQLVDALKRSRACTNISEVDFPNAIDAVIRIQPDLVFIRLENESRPEYHAMVREIRETAMGRIVVVGPAVEAKSLLQFLQEGAYQYIDQADFDSAFESLLDKLRNERLPDARRGRAIAVVGAGGGCGASTLAVNMAAELARSGNQVALMDLNLESGDLATLLNLRPQHSISDFCRNLDRMDRKMFDSCITPHPSGLHVLAAPNSIDDIRRVTPRGIRRLLFMTRARFPYVIIDIGQAFREVHALALQQCDVVVLALRLDFCSLHHASRALGFLADAKIPKQQVRPVVNRYRRGAGLSVADVEKTLGMRVSHVLPDDPRRVSQCNDRGTPIVDRKRRSTVGKRLCSLAHSVNGVLPMTDSKASEVK